MVGQEFPPGGQSQRGVKLFLPPANEGYVFTRICLSVHGGGGVSQHALQVSRPTPRGEVEGSGLGGLQAHTWGGLQAHTRGRMGIPACTEASTSPSRWLLLRLVRILLDCIHVRHNFVENCIKMKKKLNKGTCIPHTPPPSIDPPITNHTDRYTKGERGGMENNRNMKNLLISHQPMGCR